MQQVYHSKDILLNSGKCPICQRRLLVETDEGQLLKSRVFKFEDGQLRFQ